MATAAAFDADDFAHRLRMNDDDLAFIVAAAAANRTFMSAEQAYTAWSAYSESSCASWLRVDNVDEVNSAISSYQESNGSLPNFSTSAGGAAKNYGQYRTDVCEIVEVAVVDAATYNAAFETAK